MLSFRFILYTSKTYKNGNSPVMLQATSNGQVKRMAVGFDATPKEWDEDKQRFRKNTTNFRSKNTKLDELEMFAQSLLTASILERKKLSLDEMMQRMKNESASANVAQFFDEKIKELQAAGSAGNAFIYTCAKNSLLKFAGDKLTFSEMDYRFLTSFENSLRTNGAHDGGISNYMRTIRALYNEAIRRGIAEQSDYPFSTQFNKNGYSIAKFKTVRKPRALAPNDLELLKSFDYTQHPDLARAYQMFMFSFYEFGINFADMAHLTHDNIQDDYLRYTRKKTKKEYNLPLHSEALKILAWFGGKDYLFPIFTSAQKTEQQKLNRIMKKRKQFNKAMNKIGELLGIKTNITSYVARHSSATTLKRKGVSEDVISEALGHTDLKTTKIYLAQFDNQVLKSASLHL